VEVLKSQEASRFLIKEGQKSQEMGAFARGKLRIKRPRLGKTRERAKPTRPQPHYYCQGHLVSKLRGGEKKGKRKSTQEQNGEASGEDKGT